MVQVWYSIPCIMGLALVSQVGEGDMGEYSDCIVGGTTPFCAEIANGLENGDDAVVVVVVVVVDGDADDHAGGWYDDVGTTANGDAEFADDSAWNGSCNADVAGAG
jgi:hypothetical protein